MTTYRKVGGWLLAALSFASALVMSATPASAQATRTWVSGVGDDANPCSRTAPCKTFPGAISKTAAGGEINCLDPGGFGPVTITKSISIVCQYSEAGVTSTFGSSGIIINAAGTDTIYLRGLDLNGISGPNPGLHGIRVLVAGVVHIEDTLIRNYRATGGTGIQIAPSTVAQVTITDTTIADNGTATGGGILIQPTGSGSARVTLRNVRIRNNTGTAFKVDTTGNTGAGINFNMEDVAINGSTNGISVNAAPATTGVVGLIDDTTINDNTGTGIAVTGGAVAVLRVRDSTITRNGTGVNAGTATIGSFGNNVLIGNTANGAFTGAVIPPA